MNAMESSRSKVADSSLRIGCRCVFLKTLTWWLLQSWLPGMAHDRACLVWFVGTWHAKRMDGWHTPLRHHARPDMIVVRRA